MNYKNIWRTAVLCVFSITMLACSGGGDGDGPIGTGLGNVKLSGTAAEGSALANATIHLKDSSGAERSVDSDNAGHFSFDVTHLTPPFLLRAQSLKGKQMFSIASKVDSQANANNIVNIHPLSDVVARNWFASRGRDIETEFNTAGGFNSPAADQLQNELTALVTAIRNLLQLAYNNSQFSVASDFNLLDSPFQADSTGFDKLLDNLSIKISNNSGAKLITIRLIDPTNKFVATIVLDFDLANDLSAPDTEAPSTPGNFVAFASSPSSAVLVWNPSSDNIGVAGYRIYRDGTEIATTLYPIYSDVGLNAADPNCYTVEAFDGTGNPSPATTEVCVSLPAQPDTTAPGAASGLVANAVSANEIDLTWTPSQDNDVRGYDIYRGTATDLSLKIATLYPSSYEDINLFADAEYCYKVVAVDFAGNQSLDSNVACATTTANPTTTSPPNPPNVTGTASPTNTNPPTWNWTSAGGNGNGTFQYKLDNTDLSVNTIVTSNTTYTPASPLAEGSHTLYVQEQNSSSQWSASGSFSILIDITAPTTSASPTTGSFNQATLVSLSCNDAVDANCKIYYTLDGTTPTTASTLYSGQINLTTTTTISFIAVDQAGNLSAAASETYTIASTSPVLTVNSNNAAGTIVDDQGFINCGTVCSASIKTGTSIVLTASHPNNFSVVWSGCDSTSGNTCTLVMNGNRTVNANFVTVTLEVEPNDTTTTAQVITGINQLSGYFNNTTDLDYYQFVVSARGTLQATVSHPTARSYLRLFDSTGTQIIATGGSVGLFTHTLTQSLSPGTYYLRVDSANATDLTTPYTLTLTGTAVGGTTPDANEENDSTATATVVTSNGGIQGYFDTVNDDDYFKFHVAGRSTLQVTIAHATGRSWLRLYDSLGTQIIATGGSIGLTNHTLTQSLNAGDYYIVVDSANAFDLSNAYTLTFNGTALGGTSPDTHEENDSTATATVVTGNGGIQGYFDTVNDDDYFKFHVASRSTLQVTIAHATGRSWLRLYDSLGTQIIATGGSIGLTTHTLTQSLNAGDYYIVVDSASAFDLTNAYTLTFNGTALGGSSPDLNEENDSTATATLVTTNGGIQGYFDTVNDDDYFKFHVASRSTLQVTIAHPTGRSWLRLMDSLGTQIIATGGSIGLTTHTLTQSLNAGDYYIRVQSASAFDISNAYTLTFNGTALGGTSPDTHEENDSTATATVVTSNGGIQGFFDTVNDDDYFKFHVASRSTLQVTIAHPTGRSWLRLTDSLGTQIIATGGSIGLTTHTLTQSLNAGDYYIRVQSASAFDLTNAYTLTFNGTALGGTSPDTFEENDSIATAKTITENAIYNGYFDTVNDTDFYAITVSAAGTFQATINHPAGRSFMRIYDSGGTVLVSSGGSIGLTTHTISTTVSAGSTIYLEVQSANAFDLTNAYNLSIAPVQ